MATEKNKGLYSRYYIEKMNGEPVSNNARYFVMRYDNFGSDPIHLKACREALKVYANAIKEHLPKLSTDLLEEISKYE